MWDELNNVLLAYRIVRLCNVFCGAIDDVFFTALHCVRKILLANFSLKSSFDVIKEAFYSKIC